MNCYVMSPEEAKVWLDSKKVKYEVCDTPIPIMGNKVNCGVTLGIGDEMQRLAEAVSDGCYLFWASSSWSVAYAVVRDVCSYEDSMTEFERKVRDLSLPASFKHACSPGTVQRTMSNHPYMRLHIDKWRESGASSREVVLMEFLRNFLE